MDASERQTQVFIVRFWAEPRQVDNARVEWRGVVEHLQTGQRKYVQRPKDATRFIATYVPRSYRGVRSIISRWFKSKSEPQ
jgi:hypothetical protein